MKNIQIEIIDKLTPDIIAEMEKIWFTADLHQGHPKIVNICNRPVYVSQPIIDEIIKKHVDEDDWELQRDKEYLSILNPIHDEWMIKEVFNKYVKKNDEVYVLGDVSLAKRADAQKWVARLNGNKHLITGNHDQSVDHLGNWSEIKQIKDFTFSRGNINIHIVLCHYPLASWNRKIHGAWHLYGHVHGRFQNTGLSWDVGLDNTKSSGGVLGWCRPVNLIDIIKIMNERQIQGFDKDWTETSVE